MAWCNHATVRSLRIFNMAYQLNRFLWTYPSKVRYQSFVKASDPSFISHNLTKAVYRPCISPTWCLESGFDHIYGEDAWCAECSRQCADGKLDWYRELFGLLLQSGNLMLLHYLSLMMGGLLVLRNALTSLYLRYWTALDSWDDTVEWIRSGQRIGSRSMRERCQFYVHDGQSILQSGPVYRSIPFFTGSQRYLLQDFCLNGQFVRNRSTAIKNNFHDRTLVIYRQRWRMNCSFSG